MFDDLVARAAQRYRSCGMTAWQFARRKLRVDPVYRAVLEGPWLKRGGTVLDLGCGQGLMLALIAEARAAGFFLEGGVEPERLIGIELREIVAAMARRALVDVGTVDVGAVDARSVTLPTARTALVFDVLHMMGATDQVALLRGLIGALEPGGVLLMREADAGAGWRFQAVNVANRLKALVFGYSSLDFCFRTAAGWRAVLEEQGLAVSVLPMGKGTPYGNVLLVGTKK
jgi:SAM-dependent methyltransferase